MRTFLGFVAVMMVLGAPAASSAQDTDDAADRARLVQLLRVASQRLDLLQARQDLTLPTSSGIAHIDTVRIDTDGPEAVLDVQGWAYTCDARLPEHNFARVVAVVDDIETGDPVVHLERPDVKVWSEAVNYCAQFGGGFTPTASGIGVRVPLRVVTLGTQTDVHLVRLRVYDAFNRKAESDGENFRFPAASATR